MNLRYLSNTSELNVKENAFQEGKAWKKAEAGAAHATACDNEDAQALGEQYVRQELEAAEAEAR